MHQLMLMHVDGGRSMRFLGIGVAAALLASSAIAQVSQTYTYDALGRLTKVTPSSGTPVCYTHDPADNRTTVAASAGCASQGGGGGSNSPPDAQNDFIFLLSAGPTWTGNLGALFNDTDPDLPNDTLTVTAVSGSPYASINVSGSDVRFSGPVGSYTLNYTIKDQQNATDSATIELTLVYCEPGNFEC